MVRSNASWVIVTWNPPVDRMTDTQTRLKKLPSHNFINLRMKLENPGNLPVKKSRNPSDVVSTHSVCERLSVMQELG